jgi:hypothetical protein
MPVPGGVEHRKAPERLPMQQEPHGSCGSLEDPPVPGSVKDPGAPARSGMVRPAAEGSSARGGRSGESRSDGPGMMCSEGGSEVLEPRPWDQGGPAIALLSAAELPTSYSSEFETVEHRGRQLRGGRRKTSRPIRPKGLRELEPQSGSGPSESARSRREQAVETVRNREDGRCRAG